MSLETCSPGSNMIGIAEGNVEGSTLLPTGQGEDTREQHLCNWLPGSQSACRNIGALLSLLKPQTLNPRQLLDTFRLSHEVCSC